MQSLLMMLLEGENRSRTCGNRTPRRILRASGDGATNMSDAQAQPMQEGAHRLDGFWSGSTLDAAPRARRACETRKRGDRSRSIGPLQNRQRTCGAVAINGGAWLTLPRRHLGRGSEQLLGSEMHLQTRPDYVHGVGERRGRRRGQQEQKDKAMETHHAAPEEAASFPRVTKISCRKRKAPNHFGCFWQGRRELLRGARCFKETICAAWCSGTDCRL